MLTPVQHVTSKNELVLAVAPGYLLLGQPDSRGSKSCWRVYRMRYCAEAEGFYRSGPRDIRTELGKVASNVADYWVYNWAERRRVAEKVRVQPVRRYASINVTKLKRLAAAAAKSSHIEDDLLAIDIQATQVRVASQGPQALGYVEPKPVDRDGYTDGLGTHVVSATALKRFIRDYSSISGDMRVRWGLDDECNTVLMLGGYSLWTVARAPRLPPEHDDSQTYRLDVLDAAQRARAFVCSDAARVNLTQLRFEIEGDSTIVVATDGHRMHRAVVKSSVTRPSDAPDFAFGLAQHLVKKLPKKGRLNVTRSPGGTRVRIGLRDSMLVSSARGTFPPWRRLLGARAACESVTLSGAAFETLRKQVHELLAIARQVDKDREGEVDSRHYDILLHVSSSGVSAHSEHDDPNNWPKGCKHGDLICCDGDYLSQALAAFEGAEELTVSRTPSDRRAPLIFEADLGKSEALHLLMPKLH